MPNSRASLRLRLAGRDAPPQLGHLLGRERLLAAPIGPALLGQGDPLPLPLADQRPLELGEGAHDREHQVGHRRVLAGEGQVLLDELDAHAALGELLHDAAQVVEVAGQPIHAVHHDGVALAHEGEQRVQLRALGVLARRLVGEERGPPGRVPAGVPGSGRSC